MALDLKGKQLEWCRDALQSAFPQTSDVDQFIAFELNETLTNIVSLNQPLPMIWLEIVRWAIARGRLDELLAQALATNPGNARLRQFIIEVSLSSDTAPDTRLEALVLPQIPFVNATEWRERMATAERCVCRIEVDDGPAGWIGIGTGSLVAPDVILTNSHVIAGIAARPARAQFDYTIGADGAELRGPVIPFADSWKLKDSPPDQLDFAFVRLAQRIGDALIEGTDTPRGCLPMTRHSFSSGEPVFILQHPDAARLKLCVGSVAAVAENQVHYTTNTRPGSSGAPCFTMAWGFAALHRGGNPKVNTGVMMDAILEHLDASNARHVLEHRI